MPHAERATVEVAGARLYTERQGSGPALLLIPGGGGDAGYYEELAPVLASHYTVISYDRRGNSRSPLTAPARPIDRREQYQDALAVLAHHGVERAHVFGGSGGALIALDLLTHRPEAVVAMVAHEPPAISVLPDAEEHRRFFAELADMARDEGCSAAFFRFVTTLDRDRSPALAMSRAGRRLMAALIDARLGLGRLARRTSATLTRRLPTHPTSFDARVLENIEYLIRWEVRIIPEYVPDLAGIAEAARPLAFAGGQQSRGRYYCRPGAVLAEQLGLDYLEFPGGHTGYLTQPVEFAERLREVLTGLVASVTPVAPAVPRERARPPVSPANG